MAPTPLSPPVRRNNRSPSDRLSDPRLWLLLGGLLMIVVLWLAIGAIVDVETRAARQLAGSAASAARDRLLAQTAERCLGYRWFGAAATLAIVLGSLALARLVGQAALRLRRQIEAGDHHAGRVEHLAYHDGLTGLPNRGLFSRLLEQGIQRSRRQQQPLWLLFIDLDRFKLINDSLGHPVGDELLIEVARRLRAGLRESDTVARLGGDEFVVILSDADQHDHVSTVADKLITALAEPCKLRHHDLRITASIGIATCPQDGDDEQTLTRHADIAMYQAKLDGKNNYRFYSPELSDRSQERMALESALRLAMLNDELELFYQPQRDMASGLIGGVEALLRWQHPELGHFEARRFMTLAEDTGLILPIGKWVLRQVCEQHRRWRAEGGPTICIAVNLSARQLADETFLGDLDQLLRETGMDPAWLDLEIAESVLLADLARHSRRIEQLKLRGVRITIDDFGQASAALAGLRPDTVDTIKIDPALIRYSTGSADDQVLPAATIRLGRALGRTVVAKGVETQAQADFLRRQDCHALQGYLSDPPVSASRISELLQQERALAVTSG